MPNLPAPGAIRWQFVRGWSGSRAVTIYYPFDDTPALGLIGDGEDEPSVLFSRDAPTVEGVIEQITEWLRAHPEDAQK